jgi:hypothetical protein
LGGLVLKFAFFIPENINIIVSHKTLPGF